MEREPARRWAALGGVVFVLVNAVTGLAGSEPPGADASSSAAGTFFAEHAGAIQAGLWLFGLGAMGLVWWFGAVYQWMRSAEPSSGCLRDRELRMWQIGIGAASAGAFVVSGIATSVSTGDTGDLSGLVAVTLYSIWILGLSHHLWRWNPEATLGTSSVVLGTVGRPVA